MPRRQPLPRLWLMTDERQGEALWDALHALPKGAGVVFRHYALPAPERQALFERVRRLARGRSLVLLAAGAPLLGARGTHGRRGSGVRSASVHNLRQLKAAERAGAELVFLSPVFATRSHPRARPLGPGRFALIAHQAKVPVIALGGMNAERAARLGGAHGWGGIDAWTPDQKRKAVPM
ncbi:MAG TPA: thiamine phosphate synthase [Allosphingosinicella sp.]|nr:thiamine phosphate synthase [Allosphingosinicella sp.]